MDPLPDDEAPATRTWRIEYVSCEGNPRWFTKDVPADWTRSQVEASVEIGGLGDDPAELISVEPEDGWGSP